MAVSLRRTYLDDIPATDLGPIMAELKSLRAENATLCKKILELMASQHSEKEGDRCAWRFDMVRENGLLKRVLAHPIDQSVPAASPADTLYR